jgi:hypothetical protein
LSVSESLCIDQSGRALGGTLIHSLHEQEA